MKWFHRLQLIARTITLLTSIMRCNLCNALVPTGQPPHWCKDGYTIFSCRSCGLLFRSELPTGRDLLSVYARGYFANDGDGDAGGYADYLSDAREHRLTARRRLTQLGEAVDPGRLLDVGSAAGFFMDEARSAGWEAHGIDVSPDMSAWGRGRLGLDIANGLFQTADYPVGSFDAVTMWDYIEHSIDPSADFAKAAHVLRPGGVLMLSTGDAASLVARLSGRRWHLLTPRHHNFFFTVDTLSRYLKANNFEVVAVGHPSAYYSAHYMVHKLGTMAPRSSAVRWLANWMATRPLGDRSIRFNLGDIVTVGARREADAQKA